MSILLCYIINCIIFSSYHLNIHINLICGKCVLFIIIANWTAIGFMVPNCNNIYYNPIIVTMVLFCISLTVGTVLIACHSISNCSLMTLCDKIQSIKLCNISCILILLFLTPWCIEFCHLRNVYNLQIKMIDAYVARNLIVNY